MATKEEIIRSLGVVHPCSDDQSKVICEAMLAPEDLNFDYFDSCELCQLLGQKKLLEDLKCSIKLGFMQFKLDGKKITLFKNGRIIVRKAMDKEDVINTIKSVYELVEPALICQSCGKLKEVCVCDTKQVASKR